MDDWSLKSWWFFTRHESNIFFCEMKKTAGGKRYVHVSLDRRRVRQKWKGCKNDNENIQKSSSHGIAAWPQVRYQASTSLRASLHLLYGRVFGLSVPDTTSQHSRQNNGINHLPREKNLVAQLPPKEVSLVLNLYAASLLWRIKFQLPVAISSFAIGGYARLKKRITVKSEVCMFAFFLSSL